MVPEWHNRLESSLHSQTDVCFYVTEMVSHSSGDYCVEERLACKHTKFVIVLNHSESLRIKIHLFNVYIDSNAITFRKMNRELINWRFVMLLMSSYLFSLVFPVSITNTTSGMVTPVSAILVDRTI